MKKIKCLILLCIMSITVSCGQQKKYIEYKVKEGESMRVIAKRHNLKTKDLLRLNPDVGRRPKVNTVIIIPNSNGKNIQTTKNTTAENKEETKPTEEVIKIEENTPINVALEELKKTFVVHKVKPKETVYGLTRFYNITKEELFELNPEVKNNGLNIDQILKIRPIKTAEDSKENELFKDTFNNNSSVNLVMLLPFRANRYDTIAPKNIFKNNKNLANIVTDFFMGAAIAIDSIKKQGINVNLQVFDTGKKNSRINSLASNSTVKNADAIIGPFYYEEAKKVARSAKSPVVFPVFSKKQQGFSSSKIIKTAPDKNNYINALTDYLSSEHTNENIIVVGDGRANSNTSVTKLVSNLKKNDSINKIHVLKPEKGYIKKDRFLEIMKPKTHTWVIVTSDDNVAIANALNSMISLPNEVTVQVFSIEKNKAFNNIDNNKLAKINFSYVTSEYIDENSYAVKTFNKNYKKLNFTLPSNYATKGFDITYDVLARLASSENDLKETLNAGTSYRLVSKFNYNKSTFGSTNNQGLFIVKYNKDLSLTRLR